MSLSFPETNVSPGESNVLGSIAREDHWQPQCEDELQSKKKITIVMCLKKKKKKQKEEKKKMKKKKNEEIIYVRLDYKM